jgi:hypothetical protein
MRSSVIKQWIELHHEADHVVQQVQQWPRELSKPILKAVTDRWAISGQRPPYSERGLQPLRDVLAWADSIRRELSTLQLEMVSGDADLCELAERCTRMCQDYPQAAEFVVRRIGLEPPDGRHMTDSGKLLRMQCVRWWRRRMRAHFGQAVENSMRARGLVRRGRAVYCTDWALRRRSSQRLRTQTMLQAAVAVNELGEQMSLFDAAQASVSNPVNRRNELMTRIRGFEELATERGHIALFGTLTAPGFMHAQHASGGENAMYAAQGRRSVRAAQRWLCARWAIARSRLHKAGVDVYGFRIAEPHHDGTPHWHLLLFVKPEHAWILKWTLRAVWCAEYSDEEGVSKYRCNFKNINPALGDAAGYVAKYVAKNIDGFNVGPDYEAGGNSETTAHRVDAWASTHRIRQFQQVGGARVGVWRELRRVEASGVVADLQAAVVCADDGDWCGFSKAAQGIDLWKEQTGECSAYGEARQPCVIGIQRGAHQVRTRLHEWRVKWGGKCQSKKSGESSGSWPRIAAPSGVQGLSVSESASEARSLGPVSITVRGDGRMLYEHEGRWFVHQAVPISEAARPPPEPPPTISVSYEGKFFCDWPRPR